MSLLFSINAASGIKSREGSVPAEAFDVQPNFQDYSKPVAKHDR